METELLKKEDVLRRLAIAYRHEKGVYRDCCKNGMLVGAKKVKYVATGILVAADVLGITHEELEQVDVAPEEAVAFMDDVMSRTIAREEEKSKHSAW